MQKRANEIIKGLEHIPYQARLKCLAFVERRLGPAQTCSIFVLKNVVLFRYCEVENDISVVA